MTDGTFISLQIATTNPISALEPIFAAMLVSLTVGKVDAGVAVLLTEDKRLVSPMS